MLQFEEKAIVLREEHIFHEFVVFDHFKQINDVQVSREHFLTLLQLHVLISTLEVLQLVFRPAGKTFEIESHCAQVTVREAALVQDQVKDVV